MPTDREIIAAATAVVASQHRVSFEVARAALIAAERIRAIDEKMGRHRPQKKTLREKTIAILLRITDEQVPLFNSQRLHTLHADCRKLLDDIHKSDAT